MASQAVGEQEEVLGKKVSDHNIAKTFPRAEYILNEKEENIVQIDKTIFLDKFEDITNVILNPLTKVLVEEKTQGIGIFFEVKKIIYLERDYRNLMKLKNFANFLQSKECELIMRENSISIHVKSGYIFF